MPAARPLRRVDRWDWTSDSPGTPMVDVAAEIVAEWKRAAAARLAARLRARGRVTPKGRGRVA